MNDDWRVESLARRVSFDPRAFRLFPEVKSYWSTLYLSDYWIEQEKFSNKSRLCARVYVPLSSKLHSLLGSRIQTLFGRRLWSFSALQLFIVVGDNPEKKRAAKAKAFQKDWEAFSLVEILEGQTKAGSSMQSLSPPSESTPFVVNF